MLLFVTEHNTNASKLSLVSRKQVNNNDTFKFSTIHLTVNYNKNIDCRFFSIIRSFELR